MTITVKKREVDLPGRWRRLDKGWARALYSRRQHGYIASVFEQTRGFAIATGELRAGEPDMQSGVSVIGVYPTADAALDAAADMLGLGEERVCTLRDIDKARKERGKTGARDETPSLIVRPYTTCASRSPAVRRDSECRREVAAKCGVTGVGP